MVYDACKSRYWQHQTLVFLPVASLGRYFSFWAGFPKSRMPLKPMDWWAPSVMPTPRSWLPTISTSRAYCVMDGCYHIRLIALTCSQSCLTTTVLYLLMCMCCRVCIHPIKQTYLCVWKAEAAQVSWHLQAKGTHLFQAHHGLIFYLLQGIVLGRIIHLLPTGSRNVEGDRWVWGM